MLSDVFHELESSVFIGIRFFITIAYVDLFIHFTFCQPHIETASHTVPHKRT